MKKLLFIGLMILNPITLFGQTFERNSDLSGIKSVKGSQVSISDKYYKDGRKSLLWKWNQNQSGIIISDKEIAKSVHKFDGRAGIKVWIFNEEKSASPLTFNFRDNRGNTKYTFEFNMNFKGWRAAWIAYSDMWTPSGGETSAQPIVDLEITSPQNVKTGKLWIDRLEFSKNVDRQATPDAQIPENNRHLTREIWHWGLLHKWEQYNYDIPVPTSITSEQREALGKIKKAFSDYFKMNGLSSSDEKKLSKLKNKLDINDDGTKGAPLMQKDNMVPGDVNFADLNDYLFLTARKWLNNHDEEAKIDFVKGVRYMLNQGFAYESCMGTNHHYGYQTRDIFLSIFSMKAILKQENLWEEAKKAVTYWSGLQETRKPFPKKRDELTDSWNTILIPRLICAMMAETEQEQFRNMKALARWVNGSVTFTPGTLGGIKVDGTAFHHGGHYPGYSTPGYGSIGQYLKVVEGTPFSLKDKARDNFKFALLSLARQTNKKNWGIGVSGRHPFSGEMGFDVIMAFGYAAKTFNPIDKDLAEQYLRLIYNNNKRYTDAIKLEKEFTSKGFTRAEAPQGFYVYNHACQGIYRYNDIMVSLKGFSRNIWGAEIYTGNNRFGRYQSYGSVQIIGTPDNTQKDIITELASGYNENGWDWNRNPGTTTIHLPLEKLNSPIRSTDMLRQPYSFSGANDLENGKYGMFVIKLGEKNAPNFTPSFKANKSVFCFGEKIICLGQGITNDNSSAPTETTLFQQYLNSGEDKVSVNGVDINTFPYRTKEPVVIKDTKGYYYYVPGGQELVIEKKNQTSRDNQNKKDTSGNFVVAYLKHGNAPKNESYEYMILLTPPTDSQIKNLKNRNAGYKIKRKSKSIHIVEDVSSGAIGYAVFEPYKSQDDDYVLKSDEEIMIMLLPKQKVLSLSVCSPDLNIGEYSYTTSNESKPVQKQITLKGKYQLLRRNDSVDVTYDNDGNTILTVTCKDGIPVKFDLKENEKDIVETQKEEKTEFRVYPTILKLGESLNLYVKDFLGKKEFIIYDLVGALIKDVEIISNNEIEQIPTQDLAKGVYIYQFKAVSFAQNGKFIVK